MLITPERNHHNQVQATVAAGLLALLVFLASWFHPLVLLGLGLFPLVWYLVRRRTLRRLAAMRRPFPPPWETILQTHVRFFRALDEGQQERFRQMVKVFLDEVRITGIRTEVDDTVRVLVAASAIIPVFGFQDWEYHRLGEVLIYPDSFDPDYHTQGNKREENILGLAGMGHLSGVMVLSKPDLLAGFDDPAGKDHVGIHEFTHLVEDGEARKGLPREVPWPAVKQWIQFVARELAQPSQTDAFIDEYAYTNEHEFFAVLAEYFFKSPELLKRKDPRLYQLLRNLFHQDPASLLQRTSRGRRRIGQNDPCPCGSGKKFKDCCLSQTTPTVRTP